MQERSYDEMLNFFREVLSIEIDAGVKFFENNLRYILDEKKRKLIQEAYANSSTKYNALLWASSIDDFEQEHFKILLQLFISESYRYFFRRLEEGENIDLGERINFELIAVNEKIGQRTKLISANPDEDGIDNDFQTWIMDNCSNLNGK